MTKHRTNRLTILCGIAAGALAAIPACGGESGPPCDPAAGTICTVVGDGEAGLSEEDGNPREAKLYLPMDMRVGPDGLLYVSDWNNHRIRVVGEDGLIRTIAGNGRLGDGPEGPALQASFNHPTDFIFDDMGRIVVAAWHNSRIDTIDVSSETLSFFCGTGGRNYMGDEGPAGSAVVDLPSGLSWDQDKNLVFVDQANQIIRRIDQDGVIHKIAGQCIVGTCADGQEPVACGNNLKMTCSDEPDACNNGCEGTYGGDGGDALNARFSFPTGQAADPSGRLVVADDGTIYVADTGNNRIRMIDPDGIITTVAGTGDAGYSGDGGKAVDAQINTPIDVDLGDDGTLYFADKGNNCVRAISPDGTIDTVAGVCGQRGYDGDGGDPTEALLDRPYGIDIDPDGNLFIADTHNNVIREVMF